MVEIPAEGTPSGDSLSDMNILMLYIEHKALHYTADALREGDRYPSFETVPLLSSLRFGDMNFLTATLPDKGMHSPMQAKSLSVHLMSVNMSITDTRSSSPLTVLQRSAGTAPFTKNNTN